MHRYLLPLKFLLMRATGDLVGFLLDVHITIKLPVLLLQLSNALLLSR
jgi:hypothetical protein